MGSSVHNPDQYMFGFRQLACNGRKKIAILIGAGAPYSINVKAEGFEPLIPNIQGLMAIVKKELSADDLGVFEAIENSLSDKNLEKILSKSRALAEVVGKAEIYGYDEVKYLSLSQNICNTIRDVVQKDLPLGQNPYSEMVSWINGISRKYGVEIFTTNYDLLFEQALERSRTPYFDGFSGAHNAFFDPSSISKNDLPPRWARLWKLHGSIGWELTENQEVIRVPRSVNASMVYPSHVKYDQTQAAPFSSLFERLKNFLLEPDTLVISTGFSFADAHISSKIIESLSANPSSSLLAFQYNTLAQESAVKDLALKCPNISAYCRDGAVINAVEAKWGLGTLPAKNWEAVRQEYFTNGQFMLGDFNKLARFLAASGGDISSKDSDDVEGAKDE
tara:strand:- start:4445 stop:5617 length:1173 start_codon:yes stop_codon:yes gene_type:complete